MGKSHIKSMAAVLSAAMLFQSASSVPFADFVSAAEKTSYLYGDLDGSGRLDIFDMVLLREAIADRTSPGAGDVNSDDSVNTADLVAEMRHLLGASPLTRSEKGTPRNTIFPGRK